MSDSITPTKCCTKCQREYPATGAFFPPDRRCADGLKHHCRECSRAYQSQWRKSNPNKIAASKRRYRERNADRLRQERHAHYILIRDRERARNRLYHAANRDRINQRHRQQRNQDIEKARENERQWYAANRDKERANDRRYYAENCEKLRENTRRWRRRNLEKDRVKSNRHRARKRHAEGNHTAEDIQLQVKAQTNQHGVLCCWWCGKPILGKYHVDHRIALARGGSNSATNIVITHPECNDSKGVKMPWEFNGRLL